MTAKQSPQLEALTEQLLSNHGRIQEISLCELPEFHELSADDRKSLIELADEYQNGIDIIEKIKAVI